MGQIGFIKFYVHEIYISPNSGGHNLQLFVLIDYNDPSAPFSISYLDKRPLEGMQVRGERRPDREINQEVYVKLPLGNVSCLLGDMKNATSHIHIFVIVHPYS